MALWIGLVAVWKGWGEGLALMSTLIISNLVVHTQPLFLFPSLLLSIFTASTISYCDLHRLLMLLLDVFYYLFLIRRPLLSPAIHIATTRVQLVLSIAITTIVYMHVFIHLFHSYDEEASEVSRISL